MLQLSAEISLFQINIIKYIDIILCLSIKKEINRYDFSAHSITHGSLGYCNDLQNVD